MAKAVLYVRVPEHMKAALEARAAREERSLSFLTVKALGQFLGEKVVEPEAPGRRASTLSRVMRETTGANVEPEGVDPEWHGPEPADLAPSVLPRRPADGCPHPRSRHQKFSWGVQCGACGVRVR